MSASQAERCPMPPCSQCGGPLKYRPPTRRHPTMFCQQACRDAFAATGIADPRTQRRIEDLLWLLETGETLVELIAPRLGIARETLDTWLIKQRLQELIPPPPGTVGGWGLDPMPPCTGCGGPLVHRYGDRRRAEMFCHWRCMVEHTPRLRQLVDRINGQDDTIELEPDEQLELAS
jgi:hypothetical protein